MKQLIVAILLTFALKANSQQIVDLNWYTKNINVTNWDSLLTVKADSTLTLAYDSIGTAVAGVLDDQVIDSLGLVGNILEISLENDGEVVKTLDLSSLQTGNFATTDLTASANRSHDMGGNLITIIQGGRRW